MLPDKKRKKETNPKNLTVLLYGKSKVGKTTFVSGLFNGDVLFLDTERGTKNLDVYCTDITSWTSFVDAVKELKKGDHSFECVAVDTVDELREKCIEHVCQQMRIPDRTHPKFIANYGRGYALVNQYFSDAIKLLLSCPIGVVFISHEKEEKQTLEGKPIKMGEQVDGPVIAKIVPSLADKQRLMVSAACDLILRAGVENGQRLMRAQPSQTIEAGDRTAVLPAVFELNSDVYMEFFRERIRREKTES
jgi:hypothetical protein